MNSRRRIFRGAALILFSALAVLAIVLLAGSVLERESGTAADAGGGTGARRGPSVQDSPEPDRTTASGTGSPLRTAGTPSGTPSAPGGSKSSPPPGSSPAGGASPGSNPQKSLRERVYPDAPVVAEFERRLPGRDRFLRVTLLETDLKHPLVRVEDTLVRAGGVGPARVLESVAMAADHLLLDPGAGADVDALADRLATSGFGSVQVLPQSGNLLVGFEEPAHPDAMEQAREALSRTVGGAVVVEPDFLYYPSGPANDPSFNDGSLWGLRNEGQSGGLPGADISAVEAWDIRNDASGVIVAVVDTGMRTTHEDLASNLWTNPEEIAGNGVDDDGNGVVDDVHGFDAIDGDGTPDDGDGHGTHVAGTIAAAGNNATGVTGVAWRAQLMAIRFLGTNGGFLSDAIEGIEYARNHGARILNNSWGGGGFSTSLRNAIAALEAQDSLFVAAAGNDGSDNDATPSYPASYDLDGIVSVAASDRRDELASFSNTGATSVDLAAPGVSIRSTFNSSDSAYASLNGTSMASPHVAGAAAILRAEFPGESALAIKQRLLDTVDTGAAFAGTTLSGGRLNLRAALLNQAEPRPGVVRFSETSINVAENAGQAALLVSRTTGSDGSISVAFRTVAGTATAGADFVAVSSGLLSWADGDASDRIINIDLPDDSAIEGVEDFAVELFNPSGDAVVGTPASQEVRIIDDEAAPLQGFDFESAVRLPSDNLALVNPAPAVAATPDGGFVLAEIEFVGGDVQLLLRRYGADGTLVWSRNHLAGGGVFQPHPAVAPDGRVFVGYSRLTLNAFGQITEADVAALCFDASGNLLWDTPMPSASGAIDLVNTATAVPSGGFYLGGEWSAAGTVDALMARVTDDGNFEWVRTPALNPAAPGQAAIGDIAVDSAGAAIAGGWTTGTTGFVGAVLKMDAAGNVSFINRFESPDQQRVLSVAVNAFDEIYLGLRAFNNSTGAFNGRLIKVAPANGSIIWQQAQAITNAAPEFRIAASPNGFIDFLQGPLDLASQSGQYSVGRFNREGVKQFENSLDALAPVSVSSLAVLADGGLVFAGAFNGTASFGGNLIQSTGDDAFTATMTSQDPLEPGELAFEIGDFAVPERVGTLDVIIRRSNGQDGPVSVQVSTLADTAEAEVDFLPLDAVPVTFLPGQTEATLTVELLDDFEPEPEKAFDLLLSAPGGGAVLGPLAQARVRIQNDDFAFESWLSDFFSPPELAAVDGNIDEADPDGDGTSVLLEYAFGLDPKVNDRPQPPSGLPDPADVARVRFDYTRAGREDLRFQVMGSPDLTQWESLEILSEVITPGEGEMESVAAELAWPFGETGRGFFRIEVERSSQQF